MSTWAWIAVAAVAYLALVVLIVALVRGGAEADRIERAQGTVYIRITPDTEQFERNLEKAARTARARVQR